MSKGIEIATPVVTVFAITEMAALVSQSSANRAPSYAPSVQMAMIAGLPYGTLRDTILTHPTLVEALIAPFSSAASAHNVAESARSRASAL